MKSKPLLLFLVLVIAILLLVYVNKKMFKNKEGFSTTSYTIAQYTPRVSTYHGGIAIDSSRNIYTCGTSKIFKTTPGSTPVTTEFADISNLDFVSCMAFDSSQNLYIATENMIYKLSGGTLTIYANDNFRYSYVNGSPLSAGFNFITGMVFDSTDNLYVSDSENYCIRKIARNGGNVTTYAGFGTATTSGSITPESGTANGSLADARFSGPSGITIDSSGNLYVTDRIPLTSSWSAKIRKISTSGIVSEVTSGGYTYIAGITIDSARNLYVVDSGSLILTGSSTGKIYKLTFNITTQAYVITTVHSFTTRYPAPVDIVIDLFGNLYVRCWETFISNYSSISSSATYKITQSCLAGTYLNNGNCEPCAIGTYSGAGATVCTPCPENRTTTSTGSTSGTQCVASKGYYISGLTTPACPINTTTFSTGSTSSNNCSNALPGYYMSGLNPISCPSNATCAGGTASFSCSNGYRKNGSNCDECGRGTWSAAGALNCTGCTTGLTTPSTGSTAANQCTSVLPTHYMNGTTLALCPANATCDGGPTANTPTFNCIAGYKKNALSNACEECGLGFYGTGGTCSTCPSNTTTLLKGRTLLSQCIAFAGYFMSGETATACPSNTTSLRGSTSQNECTASAGYYMSGGTAINCPSNASCPGGTASFSCSNGYIKNALSNGCEECPIGTWSAAGATSCTSCPPNTTTTLTARTSSNQCTTSPGYYMSATGSLSCPSNANCAGGLAPFVCSNGYETNGSACVSCDVGFYGTGGTCIPCSSLEATDSTSSWTTRLIGQTSCIADTCKPNYKMNALSNNCEPCPSNTGGSNCTSALTGYYMSNEVPILCPSNANCAGGLAPFVCSNGYETRDSGCVSCGLGFYGTGGTCRLCSSLAATDSTESWTTRLTGQTSCIADRCKPNYKMNALSNNCEPCPNGTSGSNCTTVSPGYYMDGSSVLSCPSNAFCSGELAPFVCSNGYETSGSACVLCGIGFYGTGGTCVSCSSIEATDSTERWTTRSTGQTSCVADRCNPNYKMNALSNNCEPCPSNTGGPNCTNASIGYYMSGTTAVACPSNATCSGGSTSFVCDNGHMMNAANNGCDSCPEGLSGLNCTTILPGYYNNGSRTLICPSNATCAGGSASFVCADGYIINETGDGCVKCPDGKGGINCTEVLPGYYLNGSNVTPCPSNASCGGGAASFVCSNDYIMNSASNGCVKCPTGSVGQNCTTILTGYYNNGSRTLICPSNASCAGDTASFVCLNDYIMNAASNGCDPCSTGLAGQNCTTILPGYYNNGSRTLICPSNAFCPGGSASFVCADGYMMNETGDGCVKCPDGKGGINCTEVLPGYYLNGTATLICPSNATCLGGAASFVCSNDYIMNAASNACVKCPTGSLGLNCTTILAGYYNNGTATLICPSNASCAGGAASFICSNGYMINERGDGCLKCPEGNAGPNCTTILAGYYNNGSRTLICPSNASCPGGSASFVCSNGYMINERGDGCLKCPDGKGGLNCTEVLPGYYLNGSNAIACPNNAICRGGTAPFTCSNGYYLNRRSGTCDEIISCTSAGCTLLYRDPITGSMLPTTYSLNQMQSMDIYI
jgi:hypothetical protein